MIASTVISLVVYIAAALGSPLVAERDSFSDQVVNLHNQYRQQYGAPPVTWSESQYSVALAHAKACKFEHSSDGGIGENLFAGAPTATIDAALEAWMNEALLYDYNNPGFSSATGHFTQVVWKDSNQVACAIADCPPGSIFEQASQYAVCQYIPPGNVVGQFPQNVGEPLF